MRLTKAQSAVEYAIGVAAIILALVAMQAYVKRGLQGRYKDVVDSATKKVTERQFEPGYEDTSVLAKTDIARKKKIFPYDVRRDTFSEKYNYTVKRNEGTSAGSSGGGGGSGGGGSGDEGTAGSQIIEALENAHLDGNLTPAGRAALESLDFTMAEGHTLQEAIGLFIDHFGPYYGWNVTGVNEFHKYLKDKGYIN